MKFYKRKKMEIAREKAIIHHIKKLIQQDIIIKVIMHIKNLILMKDSILVRKIYSINYLKQ